jgi:23S rRNA (cytosine1962-C5)-methyltransferase
MGEGAGTNHGMSKLPRIILKRGKEKPLLRGHPWIFSGAVARTDGDVSPGDVGEVYSREGQFLGIGHVNPRSQIIFRLISKRKDARVNDLLRERISRAATWRERCLKGKTNAYRVVNGEGDLLPGLILDRYGETFVLQVVTAGMERWKEMVVDVLVKDFHPRTIYERSDVPTRRDEGLPETSGSLYGDFPNRVEIQEDNGRFKVDVEKGQKTGFYLDQRENRYVLEGWSREKRILDCFCYTGAFAVRAGMGRAKEITLIDTSEDALALAKEHLELNRLKEIPHRIIRGDAFEVMRNLVPEYDVVVLDPPPFAKKRGHLPGAARGYKDLNLQAFRLLGRDGLLFTFSCSYHVSADLFQKIVFSAAEDAGKRVQVLSRRGHPPDHPFGLYHPEGEYLKGLICRVL